MTSEELRARIPANELFFTATRSSGPGGQNVNKVSTRIELRFRIPDSSGLSENEKDIILLKLKNRINSDGELIIVSRSERTQLMNRKKAEERFFRLMAEALTRKPVRKPTKATAASRLKRIEKKKLRGAIKRLRKISEAED